MARTDWYEQARRQIEVARWSGATDLVLSNSLNGRSSNVDELLSRVSQLTRLQTLDLSDNRLTTLPEQLGQLTGLRTLDLSGNRLRKLPDELSQLTELRTLKLSYNQLTALPEGLGQFTRLRTLDLSDNRLADLSDVLLRLTELEWLSLSRNHLTALPEWLDQLVYLRYLYIRGNSLTDLPPTIANLQELSFLGLDENILSVELAAAHEQGLDAVKRYLRAREKAQVVLNEAKLILIGEGEVGKSCLLSALRNDPWDEDRPTTHGIEIKPVKVIDPERGTEIQLNGWDFGGQKVYRPTHQLFFSAPAVYLVVWKPREGPGQGFVKEWIRLVKHREPDAKILVVATHGGPQERQPDIDRQEIWDLFGREMVRDFLLVESKPDKQTDERKGIYELKEKIAAVASSLPEMGRSIPKRWDEVRKAIKAEGLPYLSIERVQELCRRHQMDDEETEDFVCLSHRLGHLIHYEHDPVLRDIVVLKPDWLSTAISFVLDDRQTRESHGIVSFPHLSKLWNDPKKPQDSRYDEKLHPLFLRLMERFDISYKVTVPSEPENAITFWERYGRSLRTAKASPKCAGMHYTSLIAQLVPDIRPDPIPRWSEGIKVGELEQTQICRIVEATNGQSGDAEGLFYQLIVRLHKYSLGRVNHQESVHWQRGLVLEDDYGAIALLEHVANDIHITVRSPYPEHFLAVLTREVDWLVESFWEGLRCDVMVPCLQPTKPCRGLFDVQKLIENKGRGRLEQPCPNCNEWQEIELLLHNAPAARPNPLAMLLTNHVEVMDSLTEIRRQIQGQQSRILDRFNELDTSNRKILGQIEDAYTSLMQTFLDEAKEGPRLFSFLPVDPGFLDRPKWASMKFRVTLWCEHSRLPLPILNGEEDRRGVYEVNIPHEWLVKSAPVISAIATTLSLVAPIAASATKIALSKTAFENIEKQLDLGEKSLDAVLKGGGQAGTWMVLDDAPKLLHGEEIRAEGAVLRQLQVWLKEQDPSFGGLIRVQNRRHEFLWVHPQFESEY